MDGTLDMRNRWNSEPLSEGCVEFLRALRQRGLVEVDGQNLRRTLSG
jgi:hypothetical protein